ncbi:MAG: SPOR domain-containing protein [Oceanospirillaceae bacterium]
MDLVVKKQIIGGLAIVFVVLVFFPLFFSGNGYKERHLPSIIPERPAAETFQNIEPLLRPLAQTKQIGAEKKSAPNSKENNESADTADIANLDQQGVPVAWTLQLASFKDAANARALRKQLLKAGHKVYSRKNGSLVKVYVGPELNKERLEALKKGLKEEFALDGLLVRFTTQ